MDLNALVIQLAALAGLGALIAALVNVGKQIGLVKDGTAQAWSTGLNLAALVGLFALNFFAPNADIAQLDGLAGQLAQWLTISAGLFVQLKGAQAGHAVLRGVPLIGKSYSAGQ